MTNFRTNKRTKRSFFTRATLEVSKDLLGRYLVRKEENGSLKKGRIVETEAYIGPEDKASHAYQGKKTDRNKIVFSPGGLIYIYLCYGIHWQLNFTTDDKKPECVLIRALEPLDSKEKDVASGPGKLTKWLDLDKDFYGEDLIKSERIWVVRGEPACPASRQARRQAGKIKRNQIVSDSRIGIDYAEEWTNKQWRFYIKGNSCVSTK